MSDTFEVTVYEGYVLDVPQVDGAAFLRNPLHHNPLVCLKPDSDYWDNPHHNFAKLHPHSWLTCCVRRECQAWVDLDGPGICPACIADLRSAS